MYFVSDIESLFKIRKRPKTNNSPPCKISPNITPNKKGNVTQVKSPGLNSIYLGIP